MLGKNEGKRRGCQGKRWLDSITNLMAMNLHKLQDIEEDRGAWYAVVHGVAKIQTRHSDKTTIIALEKTQEKGDFPIYKDYREDSV